MRKRRHLRGFKWTGKRSTHFFKVKRSINELLKISSTNKLQHKASDCNIHYKLLTIIVKQLKWTSLRCNFNSSKKLIIIKLIFNFWFWQINHKNELASNIQYSNLPTGVEEKSKRSPRSEAAEKRTHIVEEEKNYWCCREYPVVGKSMVLYKRHRVACGRLVLICNKVYSIPSKLSHFSLQTTYTSTNDATLNTLASSFHHCEWTLVVVALLWQTSLNVCRTNSALSTTIRLNWLFTCPSKNRWFNIYTCNTT